MSSDNAVAAFAVDMANIAPSVILAVGISLFICFLIPGVGLAVMQTRKHHVVRPFLVGALTFVVSQMLTRIPIITLLLPGMNWYIVMSLNPYLQGLFLGFTAGLFEEVGRFIFVKLLLKGRRHYVDGIAFGLGHGGIEAILISGLTLINLLVIMISVNTGKFGELTAGMGAETANAVYGQVAAVTVTGALAGGLERILAVCLHVGLTIIVLRGINLGKPLIYLAAAILVHMAVDFLAVVLPAVTGIGTIGLEAVVAAFAAALIVYTITVRKKWDNTLQ